MQSENAGNSAQGRTPGDKDLAEIEQVAREARAVHKKFKLVSWLLTLAIVVVFLIFGLLSYGAVKENFTEEKLLKSLRQHAEELSPDMSRHAASLVSEVGPVYGELGREKLKQVMPKWTELANKELTRIGETLGKTAEKEMDEAITASIEKSGLKEVLPDLTDEQIERLKQNLEKRIRQDIGEICQHMLDRTSKEIIEIGETLDTFDLSGLPDDEDALSRIIIHDLLMLLDKQITEPTEEDFMSKLVIHDLLKLINELARGGS